MYIGFDSKKISIHALLAESDYQDKASLPPAQKFLSTLSLRRATVVGAPEGADTGHISIHALLAESDMLGALWVLLTQIFLSTLSLRRATVKNARTCLNIIISIHALLAESDVNPEP